MNPFPITLVLALAVASDSAPTAGPVVPPQGAVPSATAVPSLEGLVPSPEPAATWDSGGSVAMPPASHWPKSDRAPFQSDHAFPNFIGPITNPILTKDPRSLTEARVLFIQNHIPEENPLGGGDFQAYALQLRLALTDRLTFIADKDGYAVINPGNKAFKGDGWLDLAAGFKYTLIRDVEHQFLAAGGFMYEIPSGEAEVFQNHGSGLFTVFATAGKEVLGHGHVLANFGYQFPVNWDQNSAFFYSQVHLDWGIGGFLYPLVEFNWPFAKIAWG